MVRSNGNICILTIEVCISSRSNHHYDTVVVHIYTAQIDRESE